MQENKSQDALQSKQNEHIQKERQNKIVTQTTVSDDERKKLMEASQVSLWLDTYDDIFSDFDPRPYSHRALSDDFLHEARKTVKETKKGGIELRLLIPVNQRNTGYEALIRKRLREYFSAKLVEHEHDRMGIIRQGSIFIAISVILMFTTTFILVSKHEINFYLQLFSVIAEPAGWFMFWEGLNLLVFHSKQHRHSLRFYNKMVKSTIAFTPY